MNSSDFIGAGEGVVVAFMVSVVVVATFVVLVCLKIWFDVPAWVFRAEYAFGFATLLWYLQSLSRVRAASPTIYLHIDVASLILLVGLFTGFSAILGFRASPLLPLAVASSALAPLMMILVRFIER